MQKTKNNMYFKGPLPHTYVGGNNSWWYLFCNEQPNSKKECTVVIIFTGGLKV